MRQAHFTRSFLKENLRNEPPRTRCIRSRDRPSRLNRANHTRRTHAAKDLGASTSEAYYALGLSYYFLEDCDNAVPWFYKMLEIVPDDKNAVEAIKLCEAALPTRTP